MPMVPEPIDPDWDDETDFWESFPVSSHPETE